ncbi:MAG: hypothetical protein QNJ65_20755 [Xenococcaceae cyanobacterium MO_234.B1]|nr:hypothetical protein [Xenococcaceae cyanobacterium MO_234.B1]
MFVQRIKQPRELAVNDFVSPPELLVLPGDVAVSLVLRNMLGMGRVVSKFIACALVLKDLALVPSDQLLMLQQERLMFVKLGLEAT